MRIKKIVYLTILLNCLIIIFGFPQTAIPSIYKKPVNPQAVIAPGAVTRANIDTIPKDHGIGSSPAAGASIPMGSFVDLTVSDGPQVSGPDEEPPTVSISISPNPANLGDTVTLTVNGHTVTLSGNQGEYVPAEQGYYTVEAQAVDESGLTGTAAAGFQAIDPDDDDPPLVAITSPIDGQESYTLE